MEMMKLVTINVTDVPVHNLRSRTFFQYAEQYNDLIRVRASNLAVEEDYVEVKNIPIEVFRNSHKPDKLLAIHPDVKQELLALRNEQLTESIAYDFKSKLQILKNQRQHQENYLNGVIETKQKEYTKLLEANWWTRLGWVFKGVPREKQTN